MCTNRKRSLTFLLEMKQPTVVGFDEWPILPRELPFRRVSLNIADRPPDGIGGVEKYFPAQAAPDGMVGSPQLLAARPGSEGCVLQRRAARMAR